MVVWRLDSFSVRIGNHTRNPDLDTYSPTVLVYLDLSHS